MNATTSDILSKLPVKIGLTSPTVNYPPLNRIKCRCDNKVYLIFDDNIFGYVHYTEQQHALCYCLFDLLEIVCNEDDIIQAGHTLKRDLKEYVITLETPICKDANLLRRRSTITDSGVILAIHYLSKHCYQTSRATSLHKTLNTITLSLYIRLSTCTATEQNISSTAEPLKREDEVLPGHPLVEDILNLDTPPFSDQLLHKNNADPATLPSWDTEGKINTFIDDCEKLELFTFQQQLDYLNVLKSIKQLLHMLTRAMSVHIKNSRGSKESENIFDVHEEYLNTFTWAERLLYEKLTENKYFNGKLKDGEHKQLYAKRHTTKIFFHLHSFMNIRNSKHLGPIQRQLTDIMLFKQGELKYLFSVFNHFSIIGSLNYSNFNQKKLSEKRNFKKEIEDLGNKSFVLIYDNFVRTKTVCDSLHNDKQTYDIPLLTQTMLALPPTSKCTACEGICHCAWKNGLSSDNIVYSSIMCLSGIEANQFETYISHDKQSYLQLVAGMYKDLVKLRASSGEIKEIESSVPSIREEKSKWRLHQNGDINVHRLTLPCVVGGDTDSDVAKEILSEAITLTNLDSNDRIFVGGDQRTMNVIMRIKEEDPDKWKQIYVSIPDLHLRKCMLHSILSRYAGIH